MPNQETKKEYRRKALTVVLLVIVVSVLHYATRVTMPVLHDVYRRLYYIPVGLAAVWFGVRGGLWMSLAVAFLYLPHIVLDWHQTGRDIANQLMEIPLYFLFSGVTGYFAGRERQYRLQWQEGAEKLERSYQELRQQADLILEIEGQLRRADRLAAIGQLAAGMTHEIRNPLGSIRGTAEILKDDFPPGHPKAEFLDILLKETDRLNGVVENFLGYARLRATDEEGKRADLAALAKDTASLVATQARKAGVDLRVEVDGELPIRGSESQLKQVILNLLLNAIQASSAGKGVTVRARVRPGKVKGLEYREVEGRVATLEVEDEGLGIPPEVLPRIFDPFFTTKSEGTGLGLAISQRIAEAYGGKVMAENRPEGGARFALTLPLLEEGGEPEVRHA
jgi:two-component system sensor histidine kinase HydH